MRHFPALMFISFLAFAVASPAFAASKKAKEKPAQAADQRKKPQKTVTIISQMRLEYHRKDEIAPNAGFKVDDVFQKTLIVSKKMNKNVSGVFGVIYKYNITENQSDSATILAGLSRNLHKKWKGSVNYISSNKHQILSNVQVPSNSDIVSYGVNYNLVEAKTRKGPDGKKYKTKDTVGVSLSFAAPPSVPKGGTLTPKVSYKHKFNDKWSVDSGVGFNFNTASRKNRTSRNGVVAGRNNLNTYSLGAQYNFNKRQNLKFQYQLKDFSTGPSDHVFRFTFGQTI